MASKSDEAVITGEVVDLPSLSANLPPAPVPELVRDNVVSTLKNLLGDNIYAVTVEGAEGIGKTTVLSQFVRQTPLGAVSIFISAANRLSYDADLIRMDIAAQVYWAITGDVLERTKYDPTLLKSYYSDLQRAAKQKKQIIYFVVDGLEELDHVDRQLLLQQLQDILPLGILQFRFIFSGDDSIYKSMFTSRRLALKTFPLTEFGVEDTRALFSAYDFPIETAREVNTICRSLPGRLAGVLRAMGKGMSAAEFVANPPTEFFEIDWKQVNEENDKLVRVLALLVHDPKPHTVEDVSAILSMPEEDVETTLSPINFLVVEPNTRNIRIASAGLRKYVADRLRGKKSHIQKLLIKRLMAAPTSPESVLELPQYLEEASQFQDLLSLLTPDHILQILERSQTLSRISDTVSRGLRGAKKLNRDADLLRFGIQKSVITELASANIWESEVAALAVLNRDEEALALANNAILREDRLQMLAALAHGVWLRGESVQPELLDQIGLLIENLDLISLGARAHDIASKLMCVSPDIATTLLKKAKSNVEGNERDLTFAHVTLSALTDLKDERRRVQAIESMARSQPSPHVKDLIGTVSVLFEKLTPGDVCKRADEIKQAEAKISVLRYWCVLNGSVQEADLVATHGLRIALGTTSMQIDSSLLADLSNALAGAPNPSRKRELIAALDGVRGTAERSGPSVDYIRMQLSIALAEAEVDAAAAEARLIQILDDVARIGDLPSRGESYARFLGTLKMLPTATSLASRGSLESQCASELESVVLTLTEATADHYLALSGIIAALSPGYLEKALDYSRVANTEHRRDSILADIVRSLLKRPVAEIDVKDFKKVLSIVKTAEKRDEVLELVMSRFEDEAATSDAQIEDLLPIVSSLPDIENSVTACRALVHAIKVVHRAQNRDSLKEHILAQLRKRWNQIDMIWARIDTGFGIARDLASVSVDDANEILTETEALKSEWRIAGHRQASAYVTCTNLAIRAFCGLLPRHLEKDTDIEALAALIEILPSYGERSVLWADLCLRTALADRLDLTERLAEKYLQPAFANLSKQDVDYRKRVLVQIAPALYRAQPSTCMEELDTLDPDRRDAALRQIIRFLLFERAPSDSVDSTGVQAVKTSYETLLKVESLAQRLTTDWMIYVTSQEVADALQSPENRYTVNTPQREDIARRFSLIAEQNLPIARQINHPGYRIITLAQALRMRQAKPLEWKQIIEDAKSVNNASDRVYVLQVIALCLPKSMTEQRNELLSTACNSIASIPWGLDQSDRCIGLAEELHGVDSTLCRQMLIQATSFISKSLGDVYERQRRLVDIAYRVDEELANTFIDAFDDDEAKRLAQSQVRMLEIKKTIASNVGNADQAKVVEQIRANETSKVGWTLVRALNAGRVQTFNPRDIRDYLELAAKQPLPGAYSVLLWYVNNAYVRYSDTDQAATFLRPIFNACVVGAQLTGQIAGRALVRLKALKHHSKTLSGTRAMLVTPGSKEEAVRILASWFEKHLNDEVRIHDPYFGPGDLAWLQIIRTASPKCSILVMTARLHQPLLAAGEDFGDVYATGWRRLFDQNPPPTEIAVIGGERTKDSPIHDRWLVSGTSGLRFGTSFNSLGLTKDSEISEMSPTDSEHKYAQMEQYLARERTEHNGERLRLTRFWLI